jgi:2-polyprenyl-6-methoxyphenol hydroxylase-like FAD-dependent oxidoreductase
MFSMPNVRDLEHTHGVGWAELAAAEPELNRLLWRARVVGGSVRGWSDVFAAFAPLRAELAELVGISGKHRGHPVLGTHAAYDVAYWMLQVAVTALLPRRLEPVREMNRDDLSEGKSVRPSGEGDGPPAPARRHAVVVGGGLAGLLAARVLASHFDRVAVLERDRFPATPSPRKGLPQARHVHVLLARGRQVLDRLLPGFTDEIVNEGAALDDLGEAVAWLTPFGWGPRFRSGLPVLTCSRDLIDWCVRRRVSALPNVEFRKGVEVAGLLAPPGGSAVGGVRLRARDGGGEERLPAELVAVADGRNSRLPAWLADLGYPAPAETVVNPHLGYASRLYRPLPGSRAPWKSLYIQSAPPGRRRGGMIGPVEGGRWLVTLAGGGGDYPPTEEADFLDFARSLRSPALYEAIRRAEPLTHIAGYRATENRLRHYERLGRWPGGLVVLGDAACAFDPVYSQGMTVAALGAETLGGCLQRHRGPSGVLPGLGRAFQRRLARASATPWQLATSADSRYPGAEGPRPGWMTRLMNRYVDQVIQVSTRDVGVRRRVLEVMQLLRTPSSLLSPGIVGRVAWAWLRGAAPADADGGEWAGEVTGLWHTWPVQHRTDSRTPAAARSHSQCRGLGEFAEEPLFAELLAQRLPGDPQ